MYYPRLRDLREDRDLVQKEIAAVLGIDQRVYSNYEIGKREIPKRFLILLADIYGTSSDYILGELKIRNLIRIELKIFWRKNYDKNNT